MPKLLKLRTNTNLYFMKNNFFQTNFLVILTKRTLIKVCISCFIKPKYDNILKFVFKTYNISKNIII